MHDYTPRYPGFISLSQAPHLHLLHLTAAVDMPLDFFASPSYHTIPIPYFPSLYSAIALLSS